MPFDNPIILAAITASLGCGVMAGLFYTFSFTVMEALHQQPAAHAVSAMQAINVVILKPLFFVLFMGTAALCIGLVVVGLVSMDNPASIFLLCGSGSYLLGCILVTMSVNVPMNNALAALPPESDAAAQYWSHYVARWTRWNHLRFGACLLASASFVLAATAA